MKRRAFLQLGLSGLLLGPNRLLATNGNDTKLLGCYSDHQNRHFLGMLDQQGTLVMNIRLPARGHGVAVSEGQHLAAVFARRPGDFVWIIDLKLKKVVQRIAAPNGHHFYGHGVFTPHGQLLCSENDYASGEGMIGVYETHKGYSRSGEFASGGIGPHEVRLLSDDETLVIANGGIRTHPDLPRVKSNLATMRPNLAYANSRTGKMLHRHEPPTQWHQLSIRHIAVSEDDMIAVAMQYEGLPQKKPPLIALHRGTQDLHMLSAPPQIQRRMKNYCGSIEFSNDGTRFAVSSPRGGILTIWSSAGTYLGHHQQADVCGLAASSRATQSFIASDGRGNANKVDEWLSAQQLTSDNLVKWDNHMLSFPAT